MESLDYTENITRKIMNMNEKNISVLESRTSSLFSGGIE